MKSFQEMSLQNPINTALAKMQFTNPKEIQSSVIPVAMEGKDLIACAETGSGKTAAYSIPMVSRLLEEKQQMGLVLAPTRELARQISDFIRDLTIDCPQLRPVTLVGGADMRKQAMALKKKPRIIVATPGRLIDHVKRRAVRLDTTGILVLDEGDRMLDMGFSPQLDEILTYLPKVRQTSIFTATLPKRVQKLAESYLSSPEKINVDRTSKPVASIKQSVLKVSISEKSDKIIDELNQRQGLVIIFAKTKRRTDDLAKNLSQYGFKVDAIHSGRTQGQRNKAIDNFRTGRSRILCATDVLARGIDVPQVEHVINYDLPMMSEDYVHRIGRTGRNGASGEAISFVTPEDYRSWVQLAKKYQIQFDETLFANQSQKRQKRERNERGESRKFSKSRPRFRSDRGSSDRDSSDRGSSDRDSSDRRSSDRRSARSRFSSEGGSSKSRFGSEENSGRKSYSDRDHSNSRGESRSERRPKSRDAAGWTPPSADSRAESRYPSTRSSSDRGSRSESRSPDSRRPRKFEQNTSERRSRSGEDFEGSRPFAKKSHPQKSRSQKSRSNSDSARSFGKFRPGKGNGPRSEARS